MPTVTGCEALSGFQLLHDNLDPQRANELLNNMYQMVQQQNSQAFADILTRIEESLHNAIFKNNTMREETSH